MTETKAAKSPFSKESEAEKPYRKTFWLAGPEPVCPQPIVMVEGKRNGLRFRGGQLTVTSEEDAEWVKKALGANVFEEDWPEDKPATILQPLGYAPRSYAAQTAHQNLINAVGR